MLGVDICSTALLEISGANGAFRLLFDKYLRTTNIPLLKYKGNGKTVDFNDERVVKGCAIPIRIAINGKEVVLKLSELKQTLESSEDIKTFEVHRNFYIETAKT